MSSQTCAVYILTNRHHTVLYVGVTSDLVTRVRQHRAGIHSYAFTRRYNVNELVYFELTPDIRSAIAREKQLKGWRRAKKLALIEAKNPEWRDLGDGLLGEATAF